MNVNCVSSQSFGKVYYGKSVLNKVFSRKADRNTLLNLQDLTYFLKDTGIDRIENMNVCIEQSLDKGLYAIVTDKLNDDKPYIVYMKDIFKRKFF